MSMRGWTSAGLCVVDEAVDTRCWTVAEAAKLLDRSPAEIRLMIAVRSIEPVGTRLNDGPERRGRRPRVYRALDLIRVYDVLSRSA